MSIVGIQTLLYGVDDVEKCTRFFDDFGLPLTFSDEKHAVFTLEEGSQVIIRHVDDPMIPKSAVVGTGVREVTWAVDTPQAYDELVEDLSRDRELKIDDNGVAHFLTDCGLPMALQVSTVKKVINAPEPLNAPGAVNRLNNHRKWRRRARPKTIQHCVFAVKNFFESFEFMETRLKFRLSDYQHGLGIYSRGDGSNSHHNLFLLNANAPFPGMDGNPRFHHANFGVEDVDEIMVGANYMERQGWDKSYLGLGRHRIDSALFYYIPSPTGGEAEYGTDADFVDERWVAREWHVPLFGFCTFVHNIPEWLAVPPAWEFKYLEEPKLSAIKDRTIGPKH